MPRTSEVERTTERERGEWPRLALAEWQETAATLHMWLQIVGKTRLATTPPWNHWWHVPLYVSARGLTTSAMPWKESRSFEVEFDFIDHRLVVRTSEGDTRSLALAPRPVADFYRDYRALLRELDIAVRLFPRPVEVQTAIRFDEDREHAAYDADSVHRFWRALVQVDRVLMRFRDDFVGKSSPVHFFWGGPDLAYTRFSGRPAPLHPGGVPNVGDWVMHEAYSHEVSSAGFWWGGGAIPDAAFYAYAYPAPPGYAEAKVRPAAARYDTAMAEFILPYEAARSAPSPDDAILEFLQSTYEAAANLGGWDRRALERPARS